MKILTTAFFSVLLLRKRLSATKWFALFLLAVGVAMVQIPSGSAKALHADNNMQPLKGFVAVAAACFTSGLAGVYFEMVLKNSPGDLWVRNVQLSLFSLLPALGPLLLSGDLHGGAHGLDIFRNFGPWAWGTVAVQVFGGLVTALVIKHADNILKGFATSLSILISSLASVALFNFTLSFAFVAGSSVVLAATMLYSRPEGGAWTAGGRWRFGPCRAERPAPSRLPSSVALASSAVRSSVCSSANNSCPGTPVEELSGHAFPDAYEEKDASVGRHLRAVATTLGETILAPSRPHSQVPSRAHTPTPGVRTSPSMPFLSATWQSTAFGASPPS
jgi:UDP-sugar transporter A1/2/3